MNHFKLDNNPKINTGFTTPDGYFNAFQDRLLSQLPQQEAQVILVSNFRKKWYYAAAAVLLLALSLPFYYQYHKNQEALEATVLEDYLANHITLSEEEIVNLLDKEDFEKMKVDFQLEDKQIEEALEANPNLEQYILD